MVYPNLQFPKSKTRPFFYSNFVSTVDGKVQILKETKDYWPLGSKLDWETMQQLRSFADVLIHGKTTALSHPTLQSLSKDPYLSYRKESGKGDLTYVVISNHPGNDLIEFFKNPPPGVKPLIVTNEKAVIPKDLLASATIVQLGVETVDLQKLSKLLKDEGAETVLVEGGPNLMGSFFQEDLIDEVFLTIAPKIVGGEKGLTLTMAEGELLTPDKVKNLELLSCQQVANELYLRYKVTRAV